MKYNSIEDREKLLKRKICYKLDKTVHKEAASLIEKKFSNADEYLKIDKQLIIGKVINKNDYSDISTLKPYKLIGNKEEMIPEPIKQNKLPIDDPYNDQHPQFSSLIKKLANEYGVPA